MHGLPYSTYQVERHIIYNADATDIISDMFSDTSMLEYTGMGVSRLSVAVTRQHEPFNSINNQPLLTIPRIFKGCLSSVNCSRKVFEGNSVVVYLLYCVARYWMDSTYRFSSCLRLLL